jgi:hypothetical protein
LLEGENRSESVTLVQFSFEHGMPAAIMSSEQTAFRRQTATLVVGETNSAVAELRAKHSVLFAQVLNCVFLSLTHPSSDGHKKKSEGV